MTRLIDADGIPWTDLSDGRGLCYVTFLEKVQRLPTVKEINVRHGKWKWLSCTYDREPMEKEYMCSECRHKTMVHGEGMPWEKYCPNCGARMDGEQD